MDYLPVSAGDEVALMPRRLSTATEVLQIAKVTRASAVFIQIADGRAFSTIDGRGLDSTCHIVPATEQHRDELARRRAEVPATPVIKLPRKRRGRRAGIKNRAK